MTSSGKPRLLDLFCGAGGCTKGYQEAGFYVIGVDINPQPNYCGDEFVQADALEFLRQAIEDGVVLGEPVAAVHASPPCQLFSAYRRKGHGVGDGYPDQIAATREFLQATGLPYVIENVPGAPLENPIRLCGSSFGLDVRRHRLFETNFPILAPPCNHAVQEPGRFPGATNRSNGRATVEIGVWRIPLDVQSLAMGINWMTLPELSQAIPPAYACFIGERLIEHLEQKELAMKPHQRPKDVAAAYLAAEGDR